jgi:hypothetical protein
LNQETLLFEVLAHNAEVEGSSPSLTTNEIKMLPMGARPRHSAVSAP